MNGSYRIRIHGIFESAHYLYAYYPDGRDEEMHGHTWEAEVFVDSDQLKNGISVDFLQIRIRFDSLMTELDHTLINELPEFSGVNPTAEHIAAYIAGVLLPEVPPGARLSEVRVWEGPKNWASFIPQQQ